MPTQENLKIVQDMLAAFVRGDIPAVLNALTEDVDWFIPGPPERIAFAGPRRGREQVMQFFITLDATLEFLKFEPREYVAEGDRVVAFGHNRDRMKATGRLFENDWACLFVLHDGKVAKVRMYEDTAAFVMDKVKRIAISNAMFFPDYRWHFWGRVWRTPLVGELSMMLMNWWIFRLELRRSSRKLSVEHMRRTYAWMRPPMKKMIVRIC